MGGQPADWSCCLDLKLSNYETFNLRQASLLIVSFADQNFSRSVCLLRHISIASLSPPCPDQIVSAHPESVRPGWGEGPSTDQLGASLSLWPTGARTQPDPRARSSAGPTVGGGRRMIRSTGRPGEPPRPSAESASGPGRLGRTMARRATSARPRSVQTARWDPSLWSWVWRSGEPSRSPTRRRSCPKWTFLLWRAASASCTFSNLRNSSRRSWSGSTSATFSVSTRAAWLCSWRCWCWSSRSCWASTAPAGRRGRASRTWWCSPWPSSSHSSSWWSATGTVFTRTTCGLCAMWSSWWCWWSRWSGCCSCSPEVPRRGSGGPCSSSMSSTRCCPSGCAPRSSLELFFLPSTWLFLGC